MKPQAHNIAQLDDPPLDEERREVQGGPEALRAAAGDLHAQELLAIAGQAAFNVRAAIGQGDVRASLTVLRQLGILDKQVQESPGDSPAPRRRAEARAGGGEACRCRREQRRMCRLSPPKRGGVNAAAQESAPAALAARMQAEQMLEEPVQAGRAGAGRTSAGRAGAGRTGQEEQEAPLPPDAQSARFESAPSAEAIPVPSSPRPPARDFRTIDEVRQARKEAYDAAIAAGKSECKAQHASRLELHIYEPVDPGPQ